MAKITNYQEREHLSPGKLRGIKAAANFLGVSRRTVSDLKKYGMIPYYQYGRIFYFIETELEHGILKSRCQFGK
jgi:excisionase family DNA binding protein